MKSLLELDRVSVRFGGVKALDAVSFTVDEQQICGVIGPNGAGKSTVFNCLSRLYECDGGAIAFNGHSLTSLASHRVASIGIGRTFQNLALFPAMTVRDNITVGCHSGIHRPVGFLRMALRTPCARAAEAESADRVDELIDFLGLGAVEGRKVADLPFGTQKRVEMARALASRPKLLLLDEPACGLNHEELQTLAALIREVRDGFGITVLLVEHHMGLVMSLSDKVVVLNFGAKIAEGTPTQVRSNPEVVQAYLGSAL